MVSVGKCMKPLGKMVPSGQHRRGFLIYYLITWGEGALGIVPPIAFAITGMSHAHGCDCVFMNPTCVGDGAMSAVGVSISYDMPK